MTNTISLVFGLFRIHYNKSRVLFLGSMAVYLLLAPAQVAVIFYSKAVSSSVATHSNTSLDSRALFVQIVVFLLVAFLAALIQLVASVLSERWATTTSINISQFLYQGYLCGSYDFVAKASTPKELSVAITQLNQVVTGIIFQIFPVIGAIVSLSAVLLGLISTNGFSSLLLLCIASLPGFLYANLVKNKLKKFSKVFSIQSVKEFDSVKSVLESKGEIELLNLHNQFSNAYSGAINKLRSSQGRSRLYDQLLKPITEASFLTTALAVVNLSSLLFGFDSVEVVVSQSLVYLVALSRMIPAASILSKSSNSLRVCSVPLKNLQDRFKLIENLKIEQKHALKTRFPFETISEIKDKAAKGVFPCSLIINQLQFRIGPRVYRSDDLNFFSGEGFYCLIGESGIGKSSFLNSICNLVEPEIFNAVLVFPGSSSINDQVIEISNPEGIKELTGYAFQNPYIFRGKSLLYNITMVDRADNSDLHLLDFAIVNSGLADILKQGENSLDSKLGDDGVALSGGQIKRLGLARAIYSSKGIILLDEPTSGLDINNEKLVVDSLVALSRSYIVMVASHSPVFAESAKEVLSVRRLSMNDYIIA